MTRVLSKWVAVALLAGASFWSVQPQAGVATTKHNLSISGPGTVKATDPAETQTCVFCHVPHNSSTLAPLWNRNNPAATGYTPYTSSTTKGTMGQPNGSSLLCLSCHDGTVALGELLSRGAARVAIAGTTASGMMSPSASLIGRDLSDDHPVSFAYNAALVTAAAGELADSITLTGKVKLDKTGQMQCSSCHDAHNDTNGKFLVVANTASALCIACHTKNGFAASDHATKVNTYTTGASNTYNGTTYTNPWTHTSGTTVAANACENCHRPHTAPGAKRLLNYAKEEDNCLVCHNGTAMSTFTAKNNILGEYAKASTHGPSMITPVPGTHDPLEPANVTVKHVECVDCHNPHQSKGPASTNAAGSEGTLAVPLTGVRGINISGTEVNPATHEYEVCFRCHGDTGSTATPTLVARKVIASTVGSVRAKFQTSNVSYHPVAGAVSATTAKSASLLAGWTAASTMKCSHCHNSNTAPTVGTATGPNGPHGSTIKPILAKSYTYQDTGSGAQYLLCYGCHNSTIVNANNVNSFRYHNTHISRGIACSACHDPHGVPANGTLANNRFLINFDTSVVLPNGATGPIWTYVSANKGTCNLSCHGTTHNGTGLFAY
jgi:predicted CXXCH cytochrome family protein